MPGRGLRDKELDTLADAGAPPALMKAVAEEARTMRWLFMQRFSGFVVTGLAGFAVSLWLNLTFDLDGWREVLATGIAPAAVGLLAATSRLEADTMRAHAPVRWAARRLAALTVEASQWWNNPDSSTIKELARLITAGRDHDDPRSALREIAHALQRGRPKQARGRTKPNGAIAPSQTNLNVLALVAFLIALSALAMMAVLKFS